jgi:hypothetical protein
MRMSFALFSGKRFVADVGSATLYWKIIKTIEAHTKNGPLYAFVLSGRTTNPRAVVKKLDELLPAITDQGMRSTLTDLRNNLAKVRKTAIIA